MSLREAIKTRLLFRCIIFLGVTVLVASAGSLWKGHTPAYGASNGLIAYESYDGTVDQIYTANSDGSNIQALTSGSSQDSFESVWSPDGSKIAFVADPSNNPQIMVMDANGSNITQLTNNTNGNYDPRWSPDGTRIVFTSNNQIAVMNADGSDSQTMTNDPNGDSNPAWSPDGSKILFSCSPNTRQQICSMNHDGTNEVQITDGTYDASESTWSPDGSKILFVYDASLYNYQIATISPDGSNLHTITTANSETDFPSYSPDGAKIVVSLEASGDSTSRIYTLNADGSNLTAITPNNGNFADTPSWQPIIGSDGDSDGSPNTTENAAPNGGDANGDGILDAFQSNVTSFIDPVTGKYAVLQSSCQSNTGVTASNTPDNYKDQAFDYSGGLIGFNLHCTSGATADVTLYFYGLSPNSTYVLRKYNTANHSYSTVPAVTFSQVTIGGQTAVKAAYPITDGSSLDQDGIVNGTIVDPVGIAAPTVGAPDTGLGGTAL